MAKATKNKIAPEKAEESTEVAINESIFGAVAVSVAPKSPFSWDSNLPIIKKSLVKIVEKYKDLVVTEENFESCDAIRKQCVTMRRMLEAAKKDTNDLYIKPAKAIVDSQYDESLKLVDTIESNLKAQFDVFADERIAELTEVYRDYAKKFAAELGLTDEDAMAIELKKSYFNKGVKEAEVRAELKEALEAVKEEKDAHDRDIKLIELECEADKRLNPDTYKKMLEFRSASAIVLDIKQEVARLKHFDANMPATAPITVGEPVKSVEDLIGKPPKKVKIKKVVLAIEYPETSGPFLDEFFKVHPEFKWQIKGK